MNAITEKINKLRENRGWTVNRLATEAGVSQATLAALWTKDYPPTIGTLQLLCDAFGLTLAQFFDDGETAVLLTYREKYLINNFRALTPSQQDVVEKLLLEMNAY